MTQFMEDWNRQMSETKDRSKRDCILTVLNDDLTAESQILLHGVVPDNEERSLAFEKTSVRIPETNIVEQPWGRIQELYRSDLLVVEIIEIGPGLRTGLQKHYKRRERFWLLSGEGYAEWDGEAFALRRDREYITSPESIHSIGNRHESKPLILLRVKTGDCDKADKVLYDEIEGEPSTEYACSSCGGVWQPVKYQDDRRMLTMLEAMLCPECKRDTLFTRDAEVPQIQPDPIKSPGGKLWCRTCGYAVDEDEGPCPICEDDLEISVTTEPQTPKVQPTPAHLDLSRPEIGDDEDTTDMPIRLRWWEYLWANWPVHNIIAHPISEILTWIGLGGWGNKLHDVTVPPHREGEGRG